MEVFFTFAGTGEIPNPVMESIAKAEMIHDVIVSGTEAANRALPSLLR